MASDGARGRRIAKAVDRIETACMALSGGERLNLPTRSRYDNEMLLIFQLERLAQFLEGLSGTAQPEPDEPVETGSDRQLPTLDEARALMDSPAADDSAEDDDAEGEQDGSYQQMSNNRLKALIEERGLEKGSARSKAELIAVLETADEESE